jgi:surface carbohydrate biosynthesis protein
LLPPRVGPDVFLPIEIVPREYSGHLLLAVELASRGRRAVIGHKGPVARSMVRAERAGLLFYKNDRTPDWASGLPHARVGLDPEAGIVYERYADFHTRRGNIRGDSSTRAFFCFGRDDHDFLVGQYPGLADRFHLTGAPRVALWGPSGLRFHAADSAAIRARFGDFVLFASSGGFRHERLLGREGKQPDRSWDAADHAHHFLERALAVARESGLGVVVRPHPTDSWAAWHDVARHVENLEVSTAHDLAAWTRAAVAVVQPGKSTAAFEAVCGGIPAISTESQPELTNVATRISHRADTTAEVLALVERARSGSLPVLPDRSAEELLGRKLHHPIEGAAQRVADVLDAVVPFEGSSGLRRLRSPRRTRRGRKQHDPLGSSEPPPFKRPPLLLERVEQDVQTALEVLGRSDAVRVRPDGDDCFVLTT